MSDIDQNKWRSQLKSEEDCLIIDVRTSEEFEQLRLPNSINIDFYNPQDFMQELEKLDKNKVYYIYCRTGSRSANTCELMKEIGFAKTYNLLGGITEWEGEVEGQNN
jgi:rhodanese-related sulfurtransferase